MILWFYQIRVCISNIKGRLREVAFQNKLIAAGNKVYGRAKISPDSVFEGKNVVNHGCELKWMKVGFGTYFGQDCYFERTRIGRYTCIASRVKVVAGRHPTEDFVSMHPAFFSKAQFELFGYINEQKYKELKFVDEKNRIAVEIGNDVWVGSDVKIMEGVKIADGAVIGTGAVVTKDVEPYTIVAGVPARKIGRRFTEKQAEALLHIRWWDKGEKWIAEHAGEFDNVQAFVLKYL